MPDTTGPFAKNVSSAILQVIGFSSPREHPKWQSVADTAQHEISKEVDRIARVAENYSAPRIHHFVEYETFSCWWFGLVFFEPLRGMAAAYVVWKARRKYAKYQEGLDIRRRMFHDPKNPD